MRRQKSIIADRLREARLKKKLTQADVGKLLALHPSAVSKFENCREPKLQNLIYLAQALGVNTDYLLGLGLLKFPDKFEPTHRHKNGNLYQHLADGKIEATLASVAVYCGHDGLVWVRPLTEFNDGRFTRLKNAVE